MKKILILFLTIVTFSVKSQTVEVNYSVEIDISGLQPKPFNHRYLLSYSNGKSLQKKFLMGAVSTHVINKNDESTRVIKIGNDTTYVYKDFSKNILYSEERIFTKVLSVADQLNIFSWKIEEDTLTILKHKCRMASANFRGRDYVAYFAADIPIPDGPGKFNGLPGLILKILMVNSTAVFSVEAVEIRFNQSNKENANPFIDKKLIMFTDFRKEYNRKYAELQSFSAEQAGGVTIQKGGLEILSDE